MPGANDSDFGPVGSRIDIGLDGGQLFHGSPPHMPESINARVGRSLWWIPDSVAIDKPLYSVVSSRVGRNPHRRPTWFYMLERAIEITTRDNASVLIVVGTASAKWASHACERFRIQPVRIKIADWNDDVSGWLDRLRRDRNEDAICVSPPIEIEDQLIGFPRRDVLSIVLAERVFAPLVSSGGNIEQLLAQRLEWPDKDPSFVWVAAREAAAAPKRLIEQGAVGWFVSPAENTDAPIAESKKRFLILDELLAGRQEDCSEGAWPYLAHCTRERSGPWPGQSEKVYKDELLLSGHFGEQGALRTLNRILDRMQIRATDRVTRGEAQVICFSAVPISELLSRRTYRSHLGRWDYEPYGIAIRRTALESIGCRSVTYGDDQLYESLEPSDRPFFQSRGDKFDWSEEQEWRLADNLDLSRVEADDAFIFVPTSEDAEKVSAKCRWPIVVIGV